MKKICGIIVCILLVVTITLPATGNFNIKKWINNEVDNEKIIEKDPDFVLGEFLIKFKDGTNLSILTTENKVTTSINSIDELNEKFKVRDIQATMQNGINKKKNFDLFTGIGLNRWYTFSCDVDINILDAVQTYEKNPFVEAAEPNYIGQAYLIPNDTNFNKQWGLHNTGQTGGTVDADIDGPEAWDIKTGSSNVIIAIVDTGIDYNHEDLNLNMWKNSGEIPWNGIDEDGNGYIDDYWGWDFFNSGSNPMDIDNHGTHCSGIAGAKANNNKGIAGVIWTVKLMAVKAAQYKNNFPLDSTAKSIKYAADMNADVVSMSFGFDYDPQALDDACTYAYSSGCLLVAAMGNHGGSSLRWPAAYSTVMAVGAIDHDDKRTSWSAYGNHINVVAPGLDIYSTLRSNAYGYMWGTSMATPHVAGLAGLLKAQDITRSNTDLWTIIVNTADDLGDPGWDKYYGMGRINAYVALHGAPYKPVLDGPPNGKIGQEYTYNALTWDPNGDNIYYWFEWGDGNNSGWVGSYNSGQTGSASHKWSIQDTYQIKVKAKDVSGKESDWSDLMEITMPKNKPFIFNFPLLNWFLEKFPNTFPILRYLM